MNVKVFCDFMNKDEVVEVGVMVLFGEKYDDEVCVFIMVKGESKYFVELCGGIYVDIIGEIGLFKFLI